MLDASRVAFFTSRYGNVCAPHSVADQQRVALRVVARAVAPSGSARARGSVFWPRPAEMPFETIVLRVFFPMWIIFVPVSACWRLFVDGDRVELAHRVVALQDAARVLPGDRRAGLDLRPRDLRALAAARAALGDEVVDAAAAFLVAGVPVLHRRVLDLGVVERDELDHRRVQLVLVALRRGAALEVGDVGALVGDDQRALELARSPAR